MAHKVPPDIINIIKALEEAGFEAYAVGGAVRDFLREVEPKDWDVATNAKPEEIQKIFENSFYLNKFGTVTVKTDSKSANLKEIEVTTYRIESEYSDHRRPDEVEFTGDLKEDLKRRDFTVNAMAMSKNGEVFDPYDGQMDLKKELIRAVEDPQERFQEDALRMLRAVRFAATLSFDVEANTREAIKTKAPLLDKISAERIRDEFIQIVQTREAARGVSFLAELGLLQVFFPELTSAIGIAQNKHHKYEVFEHLVRSLEYAASKNFSLAVRMAALFHDIGKPESKYGEGEEATFYNHEHIGAKIVSKALRRLKFPNELREKIVLLVKHHQFYYTPEEVTASSVRRLVKNVGQENIEELIQVREADRIGSGVPKAVPYKLRHLQYMIEQVQTDPVSVKMLVVKGDELMKELDMKPSPKLGLILNFLLTEVLDDPKLNTKENLIARAKELIKKTDKDLQQNLDKIEQAQQAQEEEIKKKYYVK